MTNIFSFKDEKTTVVFGAPTPITAANAGVSLLPSTIQDGGFGKFAGAPGTFPRTATPVSFATGAEPSSKRLLQNLRLPELRTLHIHVPTFAPSATTFLADIGRQSSLIHDLRIDLSAFNKELLLDALGYIPSLTKLHITDSDSWGALADESPIDAPQLLQLLTPDPGFHLSICSPVSEDILFAFLQNRIDLETDFRALKIFFQREEASKHNVERFRERGLKIQFKFPQLRKSLPTPWYGLWPKDSDDAFAQWD
ncbi:hypothetical protein C8F04DRAFT_1264321 [Mycena alexandri]|uniref:Uncharacterized protein n=1 Tax=Mycena alexandri TaxID=1745969 RepID=A0AAD6SL70_9AGAR|nr:hypothetical protein C8F04DRAFT_1264321 [Mycena alexandri]